MDFIEKINDIAQKLFLLHEGLFVGCLVAALEADLAFLEVAWSDFDSKRNAFFDPLPLFDTATEVTGVDRDSEKFLSVGLLAEARGEGLAGIDNRFLGFLLGSDRDDDDLLGRDAWRKNEPVIIGMSHDEGADETG